jgi:hypothetical protein
MHRCWLQRAETQRRVKVSGTERMRRRYDPELFKNARRTRSDLRRSAKMADWKGALAVAMKARTAVTNRWLAKELHI